MTRRPPSSTLTVTLCPYTTLFRSGLIYVLIATSFAIRIGRPRSLLDFLNERFNADYRYALVRLREYAESIAFYAGEKVEGALLRSRFGHVIGNAWAIVYRSLKFLGFNFSATQTAVVFPFILQAQRFFTKQKIGSTRLNSSH